MVWSDHLVVFRFVLVEYREHNHHPDDADQVYPQDPVVDGDEVVGYNVDERPEFPAKCSSGTRWW